MRFLYSTTRHVLPFRPLKVTETRHRIQSCQSCRCLSRDFPLTTVTTRWRPSSPDPSTLCTPSPDVDVLYQTGRGYSARPTEGADTPSADTNSSETSGRRSHVMRRKLWESCCRRHVLQPSSSRLFPPSMTKANGICDILLQWVTTCQGKLSDTHHHHEPITLGQRTHTTNALDHDGGVAEEDNKNDEDDRLLMLILNSNKATTTNKPAKQYSDDTRRGG